MGGCPNSPAYRPKGIGAALWAVVMVIMCMGLHGFSGSAWQNDDGSILGQSGTRAGPRQSVRMMRALAAPVCRARSATGPPSAQRNRAPLDIERRAGIRFLKEIIGRGERIRTSGPCLPKTVTNSSVKSREVQKTLRKPCVTTLMIGIQDPYNAGNNTIRCDPIVIAAPPVSSNRRRWDYRPCQLRFSPQSDRTATG